MRKISKHSHVSLFDSTKEESHFFETSRPLRSQSEYEYLQEITEQPFETVERGAWCQGMPICFRPIQSEENFIEIEFMFQNGETLLYPFRMQSTDIKYQRLLEALQVSRIEDALCNQMYLYLTSIPESGHRLLRIENIKAINE